MGDTGQPQIRFPRIGPEDLLKSRDQRPHRVPLMRTCCQCGLSLPSTQYFSWMIERYSVEKLVRDGKCHKCRETEGIKKEQVYNTMITFLEAGGGEGDSREIIIM